MAFFTFSVRTKIIFATGVLVAILLGVSAGTLLEKWRLLKAAEVVQRQVALCTQVGEVQHGLQGERGASISFLVAPDANRTQVRQAVEAVFGVKVTGVNTLNRAGKRRRTRFGWGQR